MHKIPNGVKRNSTHTFYGADLQKTAKLTTHPIPGMQHFCLHRRSETTYNAFNFYRRELAPGTVSLTGDRAQGDDSKHWAYSNTSRARMDCGKLTFFLLLQTLKRGVASQDFAEKHSVPTFITQVNRMSRSRRVLAIGGKHCDCGWTGSVFIRSYFL